MEDLINNLADHLGLNLAYKTQEDSDLCVYRVINGWQCGYWLRDVSVNKYLEIWLLIANEHLDAVEKFEAPL